MAGLTCKRVYSFLRVCVCVCLLYICVRIDLAGLTCKRVYLFVCAYVSVCFIFVLRLIGRLDLQKGVLVCACVCVCVGLLYICVRIDLAGLTCKREYLFVCMYVGFIFVLGLIWQV